MDTRNYISLGYYITRRCDTSKVGGFWKEQKPGADRVLPDLIVSTSSCLAEFIPDSWCIKWADGPFVEENYDERLELFNVVKGKALQMAAEATKRFDKDFVWPNVWFGLDQPRQFIHEYLANDPKRALLGLGIDGSNLGLFLKLTSPPPQEPGFGQVAAPGVHSAAAAHRSMASGGKVIGYEVRNCDRSYGSLSCSWLCNGLHVDMWQKFGIGVNENGLFNSYGDAVNCVNYIRLPTTGAEPGEWFPLVVVQYDE